MNFKKSYVNAFSGIKMDDAFKYRMLQEMNSDCVMQSKRFRYAPVCAAAVVLLLVGAGYLTGIFFSGTHADTSSQTEMLVQEESGSDVIRPEIETDMMAGTESSEGMMELEIPAAEWYAGAESAQEVFEIFSLRMKNDARKTFSSSQMPEFTQEQSLTAEEADMILQMKAEPVDEVMTGTIRYYKAVFRDGTDIEFQISDTGYFKFTQTDTVYKIIK